jgi:agmatine deiminase
LTPAEEGFAMPAEWEPHARCWMAWPCRLSLWGDRYEAACQAYAAVARAIAEFEPVTMLAPEPLAPVARLQLGRRVEVLAAEIDDSWTRDTAPVFVADGEGRVGGVAWRFNAWGNRYHPYERDARLARALLDRLRLRAWDGPMVLEGGAIHVDGRGALLTTEECLLNPNRNPTLSQRQVEERLAMYLGVRRVIWLERGLVGDETDGHVDNLARFVAPGRAMLAWTDDPADPNAEIVADAESRLRAAGLQVVRLPLPAPRPGLVLSYVNFYIADGAVFVPAFDDPADAQAAELIGRALPGRRVTQLPALDIVRGGGGIHCITREQPAGQGA